jgi:hypothetical protein
MKMETELLTELPFGDCVESDVRESNQEDGAASGELGTSQEGAAIPQTETPVMKRGGGRPRKDGTPPQLRLPNLSPTPKPKLQLAKIQLMPINEIHISNNRHRKELGDLQELADSIKELGLLQPIGITKEHELVFGERRLKACCLLGIEKIPARIVDIATIARGEYDENELRKDFTPSERVAIQRSVCRKTQGARTDLERQQDLADVQGAAETAGFTNRETCRQAAKVVDSGTPELVKAMDNGDVSIDAASQIAKQPAEEQRRIIALPKGARKAAVRDIRAASAKLTRGTRPAPSTPTTQSGNSVASFRVSINPKSLAKTLVEKLTTDDCRTVMEVLVEHLGTPHPVVETSSPPADHYRIANDVIELFTIPEQIELFSRMVSRWGKTEIDTVNAAIATNGKLLEIASTDIGACAP